MRIVSLLPSATEICFALGAGDDVVGVTFECDYPAAARGRRIVSTTALPEGLTPGEIDAVVRRKVAAGEDLYHLDAGVLRELAPDVVITQDLCAVCAIEVTDVEEALSYLGCRAEVVTTDPHNLDEVVASIETVAKAIGRDSTPLVEELRDRLKQHQHLVAGPRVALLEWTDPPFAPGHWLPEMVELAGGTNVLGTAGQRSVSITWDDVRAARPEVIVSAPCGFDLDGAAKLTAELPLPADAQVWAVDANGYFARPGPRLVDGIDVLAAILQGEAPDHAIRVR
ncbi:cobalamin-binding protein [Kribbella sp. NPDC058693]|uniref:cobalamin-binding protein n=1 Tax=Kribbella sp. NPDC058693 TaxID=3346602 RepID=UPI003651048D